MSSGANNSYSLICHRTLGPIVSACDRQLRTVSPRVLRQIEKSATAGFFGWLAIEGNRLKVAAKMNHGTLVSTRANGWYFTDKRGIPELAHLIKEKWDTTGAPPSFFIPQIVIDQAVWAFAARRLTIDKIKSGQMDWACHKYATQEEACDKHVFFVEQLEETVLTLIRGP